MDRKKKIQRAPRGGAYYFWLGFLIPALITLIGFIVIKVWPFGDGTVLIIDSLHQYLPFYTEFHEKLTHAESLFYSFKGGFGFNFWGTYAYYMASPLNFLIALVPTAHVCDFMDLMILLKIALCGGTFSWYLHKRRPDSGYLPVVFASMYALGNFLIGYYFNLMWLDSIAMLPLIMYGIEKLVKGKRAGVYLASLAYGIWCNYYIGFMLCLFSCLYLAVCLAGYKGLTLRQLLRRCLRFGGYSLLAGGIGGIILVPAYMTLASSEAMLSNTFPTRVKFYTDFVEMMMTHFAGEHPINIADGQVGLNAYCGVAVLILVVCYILNDRIDPSEKAGKLFLTGFMLLSFSTNILNYIWHGFHNQNGLPNRFAFIYVVILLIMCFDCVQELWSMAPWKIAAAGAAVTGFAIWCVQSGAASPEGYDGWPWLTTRLLNRITLVLLVVYTLAILILRVLRVRPSVASAVLGGLLFTEAAVHGICGICYNENVPRRTYLNDQARYRELTAEQEETGFYRSEIDSQRMRNVTMFAGGYSTVMFNSTMLSSVTDFCDKIGMEARTNKNGYIGVTGLMNDVFGIRYVLSTYGKGSTLYGFEKVGESDNYAIYRNEDALSIGFMVNEEILDWELSGAGPMAEQNEFVVRATGMDPIFVLDRNVLLSGDQTEKCRIPENKQVYLELKERASKIALDTPEYERSYATYTDHLYVLDSCDGEDLAEFTLTLKNEEDTQNVAIYTCADSALEAVNRVLAQSQLEDVTLTGDSLTGRVQVQRSGVLMITVPFEKNWAALVDGEAAEIEPIAGTFMGIRLEEGEHEIELRYHPAGFNLGMILTLVSALLAGLVLWIEKRYGDELPVKPAADQKDADELQASSVAEGKISDGPENETVADRNDEEDRKEPVEDSAEENAAEVPLN
ncbi:MAG: YfhO family protein [Lachnospiraceae bacterium]|nr:YfhO family protein [Lachnospiraceae bacterium]